MIKFILYALSSIGVLGSSLIGPAMGEISLFFHNENPTLVKMIMTTPGFFLIICSFLANPIARKIGKKYTLILGLAIYCSAGIGCTLASNIYVLLFYRAILGLGLGIMVPVAQSLPLDLFSDTYERNKVIARQGASINAGNVVMTLLAGLLASISWRYTFTIYTIALPMALLVFCFLPNISTNAKEEEINEANKDKINIEKLPLAIYSIAFTMFCFFATINAFYINVAILIQERAIGDSRLASYILSAGALSSFCLAMNLQKILAIVKDKLVIIVCFTTSFGFILLNYTYDKPFLFLIAMITSASAGCIIPSSIMRVSSIVKQEQSVKALAMLNSCMSIGSFLSPVIFDNLPILSVENGIIGGRFLTLGCLLAFSGFALIVKRLYFSK